jgi:hypothetical protein
MLVKHLLYVGGPLERFQRLFVTVFPRLKPPGVARVSLGLENTEEDVDRLLEALARISGLRRDKGVQRQMDVYAAKASRTVDGVPPAPPGPLT